LLIERFAFDPALECCLGVRESGLRHQIGVLQIRCKAPENSPRSPLALAIVTPETVLAGHRAGFRLFWTLKARRGSLDDPSFRARDLIRQMCRENPLRELLSSKLQKELGIANASGASGRKVLLLGAKNNATTVAARSAPAPGCNAIERWASHQRTQDNLLRVHPNLQQSDADSTSAE